MITDVNCNECYNYIIESVIKIDKLQKEVITANSTTCIGCETSLYDTLNNTIPVTLYTNCGSLLTATINTENNTTTFFRIEAIRYNRFVTLRLLTTDPAQPKTLIATNQTMIYDLNCVCGIECFQPITVEICTSSTTTSA